MARGIPGPGKRGASEKPRNAKKALAFLWKYIACRKWLVIIALSMTLVNVIAGLSATALLQPLIDNYLHPDAESLLTAAQRVSGLLSGVIKIACVYLAQVAAQYIQNRLLVRLSQKTINNIRTDMFGHMQRLPVSFFDRNTRGEIMSRFTNDCDTLNDALQNSITTVFSSSITIAGIIIMMLTRNVVLTLINLLVVPVLMLTVGRLIKKSSEYFVKRQNDLGEVNGYVEEIITGEKVVKVFGRERQCVEKFDELNEKLSDSAAKAFTFSGMMMPLSRNINNIVYALIATLGGIITTGTALSMGQLVVFLQLSSQFGRPMNEVANQLNSVISALAGAERICELMEQQPESESGRYHLEQRSDVWQWNDGSETVPLAGDVRFKDVDFGYLPQKQVLFDLSLYAKPGQKIAFVGSTGAGKTTIINLLARFYDITDGTITMDGIDQKQIDRASVRRAMAVVLQDTHLFTGTVRDNIRYGRPDATDAEVEKAAKLTRAHSFIRRLPKGYDTVIEGDGANLSQGQRQLLNIARAAVAKAPILVLDEATSSVDTRTERNIEKGLDTLMRSSTTFIIAHRLSTVRNANAIMVMENGRIIERGTHDDLLALKGRYYELYTGKVELA